jgi:hypothetical protein
MKKLLALAILLLPCVPSFIVGCKSQVETTENRRAALMEQRFISWCKAQGYTPAIIPQHQLDVLYFDVWSETDDYTNALDSVDSVLSIANQVLTDK